MIRKPVYLWRALVNLVSRLDAANGDLKFLVSELRNTTGAVVYTLNPVVVDGRNYYSVSGWINHFQQERAEIVALRGTAVATVLDRVFPEYIPIAADYVQDIGTTTQAGTILRFMQQALNAHPAENVALTNGERSQLANAIENLIEP